MSGPWEKYAQPAGPWSKYAQPAEPADPGLMSGEGALSLAQSATRGATFGLSDRAGALASSLFGGLQSAGEYGDFGGTYSENLTASQEKRDQFADAHPVADIVANLAGGIATGLPIAKVAQALPWVQKVYQSTDKLGRAAKAAKYGITGLAAGTAAGAGNAREGEVLEGAAKGGATGALLGAAVPPVLSGIGRVTNFAVGTPARAIVNAARSPEAKGVRRLAKALGRDEMTPTQLEARLAELGPNATIADAAGKNVLAEADRATVMPGMAKNAGLQMLEERAKGAGPRTVASLNDALGVQSTNVDDLVQGLHENMRNVAKTHDVDRILNTGAADMTGDLEKLMDAPMMKKALGRAYSIIGDDIALGRADRKTLTYFDVGPDGKVSGFKEVPTLRALDYVKRGLDSIINDGTDAVTGKMTSQAERAYALKRGLLKNVDNINPDYKAYRVAYADEKAGESALTMGRAFMGDDSEAVARRLADMTPAERKYFQAGAARAVYDKIMAAPDTGMAYSVFLKRPLMREKLQAAFGGDTPQFQRFMKGLESEARMGETHATLGKNSLTAARAAVAQDAGTPIAGGGELFSWKGAAKAGLDYLQRPGEEESAQLLQTLLTADRGEQSATLRALRELDARMARPIVPESARVGGIALPVKGGANYLLTQQAGGRAR